jgi:hypothetical protein
MGMSEGSGHKTRRAIGFNLPKIFVSSLRLCHFLVGLLAVLWFFAPLWTEAKADTVADYWEKIYAGETVEPAREPTPETPAPAPAPAGAPAGGEWGNPAEYVTLRYGIEYTRNFVSFTDRPTRTFVVDDGPALSVTPSGLSFPSVFDGDDDRMYSYLSLGTRAYGSSRVSTYVSLVTYHDLDSTPDGSPFISVLDGFNGRNRTDLINAYADINGLTKQGPLSQVSARLGRQFAFDYDSWLLGSAVVDGVSLRHSTARSEVTTFFGWRESFFADPSSHFTTGGSFSYRLRPETTARVDFFQYQSSQRYAVGLKQAFDTIYVDTYLSFINTDPIELGVRASYSSPDSPWSVYSSFLQQLSANDFIYDIWFSSRDQDRIRRLNLFRISPASQFTLDVDRQIFWWLSAGVGGWFRFLNSGNDQGPFDNSFQEGSVRLLLTPLAQWDYFAQYRYHRIERGPAGVATLFDDISRSGETSYQEVSAEARYRLHSRLRVMVGGYFRLLDTQTRLVRLVNVDTGGLYAGFRLRLTNMVDFRFQYGVDSDYREFNPDIDLGHTVRIGVDVRYN